MGKTSSETKNRWNEKTYKQYRVFLRKDEEGDLIKWVEDNKELIGLSNMFRAGVEALKE